MCKSYALLGSIIITLLYYFFISFPTTGVLIAAGEFSAQFIKVEKVSGRFSEVIRSTYTYYSVSRGYQLAYTWEGVEG